MSFVSPARHLPCLSPAVPPGAMFPVHRIYCVGCNYVEHAKEMASPAASRRSSS